MFCYNKIYKKFILDEKYGFNKSSPGLSIKDTLISTVLMLSLGGLVIWCVGSIMSGVGMLCLYIFLFIFGFIRLINIFFPTVRALFFDKVTPLEDGELKESIE